MARRHLTVLPTAPKASEHTDDPPAWHWIPLGTVVSVVVFALLAQGAAKLAVMLLAKVYPPGASAAQITLIRASDPVRARGYELAAGVIPVAGLLLSVALGAYVIGRYGDRTNNRHGMLSGAVTALVFWAVTGWLSTMLVMVPLAMAVGWGATAMGFAVRNGKLPEQTGL